MSKIITISDRGQITIPKKVRDQVPAQSFRCQVYQGQILLTPLQMTPTQISSPPQPTTPPPYPPEAPQETSLQNSWTSVSL